MAVFSGGKKSKKNALAALASESSIDEGQDKVNGKTTDLGVNQFQ